MYQKNEHSTVSLRVPVTLADGTLYNAGVAYGSVQTPAAAGTLLDDDAKGSFKFTVTHTTALTVGNTTFAVGDVAKTFDTGVLVQDVWLTIDSDQKTPVATILEGLHAEANRSTRYKLTVFTKKDGVWIELAWKHFEIIGEPI